MSINSFRGSLSFTLQSSNLLLLHKENNSGTSGILRHGHITTNVLCRPDTALVLFFWSDAILNVSH